MNKIKTTQAHTGIPSTARIAYAAVAGTVRTTDPAKAKATEIAIKIVFMTHVLPSHESLLRLFDHRLSHPGGPEPKRPGTSGWKAYGGGVVGMSVHGTAIFRSPGVPRSPTRRVALQY